MEAPGRGGAVTTPGTERVRDATADDLPALAALDRAATGEDRAHLLRAFVTPDTTRVVSGQRRRGTARGFMVRAPWGGGATIAPDPDDALALLDARRDAYPVDRRVRCGILEENRVGLERLMAARLERGLARAAAPSGRAAGLGTGRDLGPVQPRHGLTIRLSRPRPDGGMAPGRTGGHGDGMWPTLARARRLLGRDDAADPMLDPVPSAAPDPAPAEARGRRVARPERRRPAGRMPCRPCSGRT